MRRIALTIFSILLGRVAVAQINDAEAIAQARQYVSSFAPERLSHSPKVFREEMPDIPGGPDQRVSVYFGDALVWLNGAGTFSGFTNGSAQEPVTGGVNRWASDEEAWRALESMLGEFEIANGLTRKTLERASNDMRPNEVNFTLAARPYGYEADGGNVAYAVVHRVTGKIISLHVGRGWQYEPPNILVSEETAINNVRLAHGGTVGDWSVSMRYTTFADRDAPEYVRQMRLGKTMRLHYVLYSPPIGTAFVDSVTGDIVHFGSTDEVAGSRKPIEGGPSDQMSAADGGKNVLGPTNAAPASASGPAAGEDGREPWQVVVVIIAALLAVGGAVAFLRRARAS